MDARPWTGALRQGGAPGRGHDALVVRNDASACAAQSQIVSLSVLEAWTGPLCTERLSVGSHAKPARPAAKRAPIRCWYHRIAHRAQGPQRPTPQAWAPPPGHCRSCRHASTHTHDWTGERCRVDNFKIRYRARHEVASAAESGGAVLPLRLASAKGLAPRGARNA